MDRLPFSHYREAYMARMRDVALRRDFVKVLDWLSDRPGAVVVMDDLVRLMSEGGEPDEEAFGRAIGVAAVMTSWPDPVAIPYFMVKDAAGGLHEAVSVKPEALDGREPYVIEETGEVVEDFPSNAYPRFRIVDFVPEAAIREP